METSAFSEMLYSPPSPQAESGFDFIQTPSHHFIMQPYIIATIQCMERSSAMLPQLLQNQTRRTTSPLIPARWTFNDASFKLKERRESTPFLLAGRGLERSIFRAAVRRRESSSSITRRTTRSAVISSNRVTISGKSRCC